MLGQSIKQKDPMKVGKFGLGFKSVFHLTGTSLCFGPRVLCFVLLCFFCFVMLCVLCFLVQVINLSLKVHQSTSLDFLRWFLKHSVY